jgi:hypothetical protein
MLERAWQHKMLFGVGLVALSIASSGCGGGEHIQPAPGQPAAPGQARSGSHSPAYNDGYEEGNQHMTPNISGKIDCQFDAGRRHVERRDSDDWVQGCVDGIRDMNAEGQSGPSGSAPTSTVPCVEDPKCPSSGD